MTHRTAHPGMVFGDYFCPKQGGYTQPNWRWPSEDVVEMFPDMRRPVSVLFALLLLYYCSTAVVLQYSTLPVVEQMTYYVI